MVRTARDFPYGLPNLRSLGTVGQLTDRRAHPRPLPFRQGNLDGLCGLYALINAIRLVTANQLNLSNPEWAGVFAHLLAIAEDERGATKLVTGGIGTRRMIALASSAIDHMEDHYGVELTELEQSKSLSSGTEHLP